MHTNKLTGLMILLLLLFTRPGLAVDKSLFFGNWRGSAGGDTVSLSVAKRQITMVINGKTILEPIKHEYSDAKLSPYPMLSLSFIDDEAREHLLYMVIGTESGDGRAKLTGFYEKTQLIMDSHGKQVSVAEKIELVQE